MNVLVTVGTGRFDRLIAAVDRLNVNAVCQIGQGSYVPRRHRWFRMRKSLEPLYRWADVIVTHGGGGTLFEALAHHKKVIGVANPGRTDRHQEELLEELSRRRHIVWCRTAQDAVRCLRSIAGQKLVPYAAEPAHIAEAIHAFLGEA